MLFLKRNNERGLRVIFIYCLASFLTDNIFRYLNLTLKINVFYINISFTFIEFSLLAVFFYLSLKEKIFKYIMIILALLFYAIFIITLLNKKTEIFDSLSASVEDILIIVFCIFYLYEQINDPTVFYMYYSKKFWIVIALLLYFSSTLFLFLYAANFTSQEHINYWGINNVFNIIKNLLFSISFIMKIGSKNDRSLESPAPK